MGFNVLLTAQGHLRTVTRLQKHRERDTQREGVERERGVEAETHRERKQRERDRQTDRQRETTTTKEKQQPPEHQQQQYKQKRQQINKFSCQKAWRRTDVGADQLTRNAYFPNVLTLCVHVLQPESTGKPPGRAGLRSGVRWRCVCVCVCEGGG